MNKLVAAEHEDIVGLVKPPLGDEAAAVAEQCLPRRLEARIVDRVGVRLLERDGRLDLRQQRREPIPLLGVVDPRQRLLNESRAGAAPLFQLGQKVARPLEQEPDGVQGELGPLRRARLGQLVQA